MLVGNVCYLRNNEHLVTCGLFLVIIFKKCLEREKNQLNVSEIIILCVFRLRLHFKVTLYLLDDVNQIFVQKDCLNTNVIFPLKLLSLSMSIFASWVCIALISEGCAQTMLKTDVGYVRQPLCVRMYSWYDVYRFSLTKWLINNTPTSSVFLQIVTTHFLRFVWHLKVSALTFYVLLYIS